MSKTYSCDHCNAELSPVRRVKVEITKYSPTCGYINTKTDLCPECYDQIDVALSHKRHEAIQSALRTAPPPGMVLKEGSSYVNGKHTVTR